MNSIPRRYWIFPVDLLFMILSYFLAHIVRFEDLRFMENQKVFFTCLAIVVVSRSVVFFYTGIYRSIWSYASLHDLLGIIKATVLSSLISTIAILFYNRFSQISRMVPILDTLFLLGFLCLRSLGWRMIRDQIFHTNTKHGTPILLVGAGKLGATFLSEIRRRTELDLTPVAFLDDNVSKVGGYIQGGFIGYELKLCYECPTSVFGYDISFINLNALAGAMLGAVVGAVFGGAVTGFVTTIHIYRKESLPKTLSKETIKSVLKSTLWISLELSIGLLIGGIIGSLKTPGVGTAIGAVTGIVLMLVATTLESNYRK